jgi:O-antigen/teichoic acid export membrane protein
MRLTSIGWNLVGLGGPLITAAITIPVLISRIGMQRFGLLSLAWGLVGFAGIFDLGVGRATTQTIARLRGGNQLGQVPAVVKTATTLSFRTGFLGAILLSIAVLAGVQRYIKYDAWLDPEVTIAAYLLALTIPIQSISAMYRGVNEAFQNFRGISLVRVGLGLANFLGPYCVSRFSSNLAFMVFTLFSSRLLAYFLFRRLANACIANELKGQKDEAFLRPARDIARHLLSFGGWFTISSLVSPVLVLADRYLIGVLISATAVSAYSIPSYAVTQLLIVSGAISGVAFPTLSSLVHSQPHGVNAVFRRWLFRVTALMLVVTALCAILLPAILPLWIGPSLPAESVSIGQILCVGVLFNSIGGMYFAMLHARGRADLTAKLHLVELPLFLCTLYFLVTRFGLLGASFAWTGRMMLDTFLLWLAHRMYSRL